MQDQKRFLRKLKRDLKRTGNRKRRKYLKDIDANPDDFDFGADRSATMNEPRSRRPRVRCEQQ